jgi:hypothetical protein
MVKVNDTVRFQASDQVAVIGTVRELHNDTAVVQEDYAASVWGESTDESGSMHRVRINELEVIDL